MSKERTIRITTERPARAGSRQTGMGSATKTETVRGSGVYPASGPWPKGKARLQQQASWGQGSRGAAGYEGSGRSGLDRQGEELKGASVRQGEGEQIPSRSWRKFLDDFSQDHESWMAEMQVIPAGGEERCRVEVRDLPLVGVSIDSNRPGDRRVVVSLGERDEDHLNHIIPSVSAIHLDEKGQRLLIDSDSGSRTVLRWSNPPQL
jgi:hypothetical protein